MKIYKLTILGKTILFDSRDDIQKEIEAFIECDVEGEAILEIGEMSEEEYDNLPEFEGY